MNKSLFSKTHLSHSAEDGFTAEKLAGSWMKVIWLGVWVEVWSYLRDHGKKELTVDFKTPGEMRSKAYFQLSEWIKEMLP